VEIVTVKDGRQHEVVAAHQVEYGAPVALPPSMSAGHVVTLKLSSGMRVELTGEQLNDELARTTSAEPMRLMVEGGEAELLLRVGRHKEAAALQRRWYRDPEVAKTTAVVLVGESSAAQSRESRLRRAYSIMSSPRSLVQREPAEPGSFGLRCVVHGRDAPAPQIRPAPYRDRHRVLPGA
jgi:hypothetical protein